MESKVIIRGHVFDYAEKAPYVTSGVSVLGALEFDPVANKVRCHECGYMSPFLATHIIKTHKMRVDDYKRKHGLGITSAICSPKLREEFRARAKNGNQARLRRGGTYERTAGPNSELRNLRGSCQAQTLFRLQVLAATLGRTPTQVEMLRSGLDSGALAKLFGSAAKALELCGLTARKRCEHDIENTCPLPSGFPTKKQLDDTRMPWPREYFEVHAFERRKAG